MNKISFYSYFEGKTQLSQTYLGCIFVVVVFLFVFFFGGGGGGERVCADKSSRPSPTSKSTHLCIH